MANINTAPIVVEAPRVISDEQVLVHIPLVSDNAPGVATYDPEQFEVIDGRVSLKRDYFRQKFNEKFEEYVKIYEESAEDAKDYSLVSEGYAKGTQDGKNVTSSSPYFQDNSKYYSESSKMSRDSARAYSLQSEGFATGTQNGAAVAQGTFYAENNALRFMSLANDSSRLSEAYASGTSKGEPIADNHPAYNNNSKYYSEKSKESESKAKESESKSKNSEVTAQLWAIGSDKKDTPSSTNNARYYSELSKSYTNLSLQIVTSDADTYKYKIMLTRDGEQIGEAITLDLPTEDVIINGEYDVDNQDLILTLRNGKTISIPLDDVIPKNILKVIEVENDSVYMQTANGTSVIPVKIYSNIDTANTLVKRGDKGDIHGRLEPEDDDEVTSKRYVDGRITEATFSNITSLALVEDGKNPFEVNNTMLDLGYSGVIEDATLVLYDASIEGDAVILPEGYDYRYVIQLKDKSGQLVGEPVEIDLPLESVVVDAELNEVDNSLVLILKNGKKLSINLSDLLKGLASQSYVDDKIRALRNEVEESQTEQNRDISELTSFDRVNPSMKVLDEIEGNNKYPLSKGTDGNLLYFDDLYNRVFTNRSKGRGQYGRHALTELPEAPLDPDGTYFVAGKGTYFLAYPEANFYFTDTSVQELKNAGSIVTKNIVNIDSAVSLGDNGMATGFTDAVATIYDGALLLAKSAVNLEPRVTIMSFDPYYEAKAVFEAELKFTSCGDVDMSQTSGDNWFLRLNFLNYTSSVWTDACYFKIKDNNIYFMDSLIWVNKNEWVRFRVEQIGKECRAYMNDMLMHTFTANDALGYFKGVRLDVRYYAHNITVLLKNINISTVSEDLFSEPAKLASVVQRTNQGHVRVPSWDLDNMPGDEVIGLSEIAVPFEAFKALYKRVQMNCINATVEDGVLILNKEIE